LRIDPDYFFSHSFCFFLSLIYFLLEQGRGPVSLYPSPWSQQLFLNPSAQTSGPGSSPPRVFFFCAGFPSFSLCNEPGSPFFTGAGFLFPALIRFPPLFSHPAFPKKTNSFWGLAGRPPVPPSNADFVRFSFPNRFLARPPFSSQVLVPALERLHFSDHVLGHASPPHSLPVLFLTWGRPPSDVSVTFFLRLSISAFSYPPSNVSPTVPGLDSNVPSFFLSNLQHQLADFFFPPRMEYCDPSFFLTSSAARSSFGARNSSFAAETMRAFPFSFFLQSHHEDACLSISKGKRFPSVVPVPMTGFSFFGYSQNRVPLQHPNAVHLGFSLVPYRQTFLPIFSFLWAVYLNPP